MVSSDVCECVVRVLGRLSLVQCVCDVVGECGVREAGAKRCVGVSMGVVVVSRFIGGVQADVECAICAMGKQCVKRVYVSRVGTPSPLRDVSDQLYCRSLCGYIGEQPVLLLLLYSVV